MNFLQSVGNVIIPCCGNGSRFGTDVPKHLIDIAGQPMVKWVIDYLPYFVNVHVIVRDKNEALTRACLSMLSNVHVSVSDDWHNGATGTVCSAPIQNEDKVLVINCDNIIQPAGGWNAFFLAYDNAIVTFVERNRSVQPPPFSYARVESGIVQEVAEKRRIGRMACAGAFLFKDFYTLKMLCKWHVENDPPDSGFEHYLAPVYNRLTEDPASRIHSVPVGGNNGGTFIRMGTPTEAADARKELQRVLGSK